MATSPVLSENPSQSPPRPGRAGLWLGLLLAVAVVAVYFAQVTQMHLLVTPWYLPTIGTVAALLVLFAFARRPGIWRGLVLLFTLGLCGMEWMVMVGSVLPAYDGPVKVGGPIPAFQAKFADGTSVDQRYFEGEHETVLVFFQGNWCPFCMNQLGQLEARHEDFDRRNARIVVSSIQPFADSKITQQDFPHLIVISDEDKKMCDAFKVYNEKFHEQGTEADAPTVLIIDRHGEVKWFLRPERFISRPSPDDLLKAMDQNLKG